MRQSKKRVPRLPGRRDWPMWANGEKRLLPFHQEARERARAVGCSQAVVEVAGKVAVVTDHNTLWDTMERLGGVFHGVIVLLRARSVVDRRHPSAVG